MVQLRNEAYKTVQKLSKNSRSDRGWAVATPEYATEPARPYMRPLMGACPPKTFHLVPYCRCV